MLLPPKIHQNKHDLVLGQGCQMILSQPFDPSVLKKRVMRKSKDRTSAQMAYYIDLRDLAERLDLVVGANNWSMHMDVEDLGDRIGVVSYLNICGSTRIGESEELKQYTKDSGVESNELCLLRAGPNATKRAAALFGVGSYLYQFKDENTWEPLNKNGYPENPNIDIKKLPDFAKPLPPLHLLLLICGQLIDKPVLVDTIGELTDKEKTTIIDFIKDDLELTGEVIKKMLPGDVMQLVAYFGRMYDQKQAQGS